MRKFGFAFTMMSALVCGLGCSQETMDKTEKAAETAGDAVESAAKDTADAAKDAAEKAGDAVGAAAEDVKDEAEKATE